MKQFLILVIFSFGAFALSQDVGRRPEAMKVSKMDDLAAIHSAVFGRDLTRFKLLVEHGADVNMAQMKTFTHLDEVSANGDLEIAKYLVEHGANVHAKDAAGKMAIDYARDSKHEEAVKFLESKGAKQSG